MRRSKRSRHRHKAIVGVLVGVVLALISLAAGYLGYMASWTILLAIPFIAWGCSHLAKSRGYPGVAAYGLVIFGMFVSTLVIESRSPLTIGFVFFFIELMPVAVLMSLPRKARIYH